MTPERLQQFRLFSQEHLPSFSAEQSAYRAHVRELVMAIEEAWEHQANLQVTVDHLHGKVRALADVRTLDDWAADRDRDEGPETASHTTRRPTNPNRGEWVTHLFSGYEGDEDEYDFHGATPDEARAKAAAWVREQKRG